MKTKRARKHQQQVFEFFKKQIAKTFGGQLLQNKRKSKRPLSVRAPIHLVIKSEKAKGNLSFVNHQSIIIRAISAISKKWNITVYDYAVNFNHAHFVIRIKSESDYRSWIRELTSKIVRLISVKTGTKITQFFHLRPWTRILHWGRDFKNALNYLDLNKMEAVGLRPAKKSKSNSRKREDSVPEPEKHVNWVRKTTGFIFCLIPIPRQSQINDLRLSRMYSSASWIFFWISAAAVG